MDTQFLENLTVRELQALNERIELAIRAAIRNSRNPSPQPTLTAAAADMGSEKLDLERERDAWMARRSARQS